MVQRSDDGISETFKGRENKDRGHQIIDGATKRAGDTTRRKGGERGLEEHVTQRVCTVCSAAIPFESGVLWLPYKKIEGSKGPR